MAANALAYAQMAEDTAKQITGSYQSWTSFLKTAARLYKYPYLEQLMIYAQRPDATACAEYGLWTEKMGRYVRRGSKGIGLVDMDGNTPHVRFVFDVSDTGSREGSRRPYLWQINEQNIDVVHGTLQIQYGEDAPDLNQQLESIASRLVSEYWNEHQRDILDIVDGSFLEEYDDFNVGAAFRQAASVSVAYMLMSRCGLEPQSYFQHEDFLSIFDFNTPDAVSALGSAVSEISETVLRQIEAIVKNNERSRENERTELRNERWILDADNRSERDRSEAHREIRDASEGLSEEMPSDPVQQNGGERNAATASPGDRADRAGTVGTDDERDEQAGGPDRANESREPDGMGWQDEQPESADRGNPDGRVDLQLSEQPEEENAGGDNPPAFSLENEAREPIEKADDEEVDEAELEPLTGPETVTSQMSLFGVDAPTVEHEPEAAGFPAPSGREYSQEVIDEALTLGGFEHDSRLTITAYMMKGKSDDDNASFLQEHYGTNGTGFFVNDQPYSIWYDPEGIRLSSGDSVHNENALLISWEDAARRIRELLDAGKYTSQDELNLAPIHERHELATRLIYLHGNFGSGVREQNLLPTLSSIVAERYRFDPARDQLIEMMLKPDTLQKLVDEMTQFADVYAQDRSILRFHSISPTQLLQELKDLQFSPIQFSADESFTPQHHFFISQDEMDRILRGRKEDVDYRLGVYAYFIGHNLRRERENYLKKLHGTYAGGGNINYDLLYTTKGVTYSRGSLAAPIAKTEWKWNKVERRIDTLIQRDMFLSEADRAAMPDYERKQLARQIVYAFFQAPDEIQRPYSHNEMLEFSENVQEVQMQLTDSDKTKVISQNLSILLDRTLPHDRNEENRRKALEMLEAYMQGTFSLFKKPEEKEQTPEIEQAPEITEPQPIPEATQKTEPVSTEQEVIPPVSTLVPAPRQELTQADIDAAIIEWNGLSESKLAVAQYMELHGRERATAAWLRREYGDDLPAFPVTTPSASGDIPWARIQRDLSRLIREDRFFTDEEKNQAQDEHKEEEAIVPPAENKTPSTNETSTESFAMTPGGITYRAGDSFEIMQMDGSRIPGAIERIEDDYIRITSQALQNDRSLDILKSAFDANVDSGVYTFTPHEEAVQRPVPESREAQRRKAENQITMPLSVEAASEYNTLKAQYPEALIGFEQHGFYEFYGDDAKKAAAILGTRLLFKEIPGGQTTVTGFPTARWQSGFRRLWRKGNDVYLAQEKTDGTHEEAKYLYGRDYLPLNAIVHIDNRTYRIDEVNYAAERVRLEDVSSIPDSRFSPIRYETTEDVRLFLEKEPGISLSEETQREMAAAEVTPPDSQAGPAAEEKKPDAELSEDNAPPQLIESVVEQTPEGYQVTSTRPVREFQYDLMYHDIAYLEGEAYQVVQIGLFDVSFVPLDTDQLYPVARVESKERLETLLAQDQRNKHLLSSATLEQRQEALMDWQIARSGQKEASGNARQEDTLGSFHSPEQRSDREITSEPSGAEAPKQPVAENYHITDNHLGEGGQKTKFRNNLNAIYVLKLIESENRQATPEEQEVLAKYVGWGGLPNAFDESKQDWADEYEELKNTLTPEEYSAARSSTLNAHYTSPTVIRSVYEALENMGFKQGNILEPAMGVGNFFGMLPQSMRGSKLYGVELDSITGRIAKQLYPQADIKVAGFETTDRRDFYDLAVGNVPFGNYKVIDRAYDKLGFNIHNYFFAKSLDQVRPGGIVAFVTSHYTMDAKSPEVRKYLAERADLLGAIRLPNNAFKANAGTEVTSDIIFLQKRESPSIEEPGWVHLGVTEDGLPINSYFVDHPEMVLGQIALDKSMYGYEKSVACLPIEGADLSEQLSEAIKHITGSYKEAELSELGEGETIAKTIPADPNVKNFSYTVKDGEVYYRQNSVMVQPNLNTTALERVKGMVALRDCVHELIDLQLHYANDGAILEKQLELNRLYDDFSRKFGLINSRGNALAFSDDSSYYLLCSLEVLDEEGNFQRKADMFTKRTIRQHIKVDHVDTSVEALAVCIGEKAKVDLTYMAGLTGKTEEEIVSDLTGIIFRLPESTDEKPRYVAADEYLSGNVRQKLREAKAAAENNSAFLPNVRALENAQPQDLDASEIDVRLGATWVDKKYIQQFMYETFNTPYRYRWNDYPFANNRRAIGVSFSEYTSEWNISNKTTISGSDVAAYTTFGTSRLNAYEILENTLNLRDVRIFDTIKDADGKEKRVLNSRETTLAQQKQQAIKDAFREWIWEDPERREALVTTYNERFNSTRTREFDGSHIVFAGMNPEITLREHQRNAIAHILYGGNTLLAHQVGAGKTFEMAAAAMESKRLGLCQKPMFVVPNHLTEQWASEFLRLYPSANILVTTKKDFERANRKKFCSRIATGDYDAVIIGHSQFERIPVSFVRQTKLLENQIEEITLGIEELKDNHGERFSIKQLERTKRQLEARLEKLQANHRKDDVVTFEELGVDRLFVDEAHSFKNLFLYTKMNNVAGLSTTEAQKSSDMFLKCRYIDEITGNRGVIFATGTPISNSMTELYTMQRYLQYDTLKRNGLIHFDAWASVFGETTTSIELAPEGTGYRARTRFSRFFNLPELMTMYREIADIKTSDQLHLPTPEVHYDTVVGKPSEQQKEMVAALSERATLVHSGIIDPSVDNMLKITSDGRKLGLDQRLINPLLPDDPNSKVNACVRNVHRIWEEGQANKLTQLVFCDLSTPKGGSSSRVEQKELKADSSQLNGETVSTDEPIEIEAEDLDRFSVYTDIRKKLIDTGIPPEQIAFIHDANTEVKKKELFAKVRAGQVRVLIGSTAKMGAGTNVQDRLIASHDLDCPWRPGDLEQRAGRIVRQGNKNPEVYVYRYVTEGTFDAYLWQTVENKQKFISQIQTSKSPVRSCEDVDATALSYAEIKALSAGDPRIKEKMDLDVEVAKLRIMKADHDSKKYKLQDRLRKYFPENIERNKALLEGLQKDTEILQAHPLPEKNFVGMEIKGDLLTDRENAGAALIQACKDYRDETRCKIGSYRGFDLLLRYDAFQNKFELTIHGGASHTIEVSSSLIGNLQRIENALKAIPQQINETKAELQNLDNQVEAAKEELSKPFPQEEALKQKSARLAELNIALNIDGPQRPSHEMGENGRVARRTPSPFQQSPRAVQQKKQKQEAR